MHSSLLLATVTLGLIQFGAHAYPGQPPVLTAKQPEINLLPIRADRLFPHLKKRSGDFSALRFQDNLNLFYGKVEDHDQEKLHFGNMTITRGSHPIILLEDFDSLTTEIKCNKNKMSIQFNSEAALKHAENSWGLTSRSNYFTLITHHEHSGCGEDETRTPYRIVAVKFNSGTSTAVLTREISNWDNTAENFELRIKAINHPSVRSLVESGPGSAISDIERRGFLDILKHRGLRALSFTMPGAVFVYGICNIPGIRDKAICPYFNVEKVGAELAQDAADSVVTGLKVKEYFSGPYNSGIKSIDLKLGDPSKNFDVWGKIGADQHLECIGCYMNSVDGTYEVWAHRYDKKNPEVGFTIRPGIDANIQLKLSALVPIPLAHKDINLIDQLGLGTAMPGYNLQNVARVIPETLPGPGIEFRGKIGFNITAGLKLNTRDALIVARSKNDGPTELKTYNLERIQFEPHIDFKEIKIIGEANPYYRLGYGFGFEFFDEAVKLGIFGGINVFIRNSLSLCIQPSSASMLNGAVKSEFRVDAGAEIFFDFPLFDRKWFQRWCLDKLMNISPFTRKNYYHKTLADVGTCIGSSPLPIDQHLLQNN
ncbi:hypothetical protein TWF694_011425 [Orbilia ellipsospora]|uniref:DUF7029 domain-containing protein n=1 Tax=Orbilia ellipsospora TaxID=2528407 RepID=A0AAV9X6B3_9PEZI